MRSWQEGGGTSKKGDKVGTPHLSTVPSGTVVPNPVGLSPPEVLVKLVEPERGGSGGLSSSPSAMRGEIKGVGGR